MQIAQSKFNNTICAKKIVQLEFYNTNLKKQIRQRLVKTTKDNQKLLKQPKPTKKCWRPMTTKTVEDRQRPETTKDLRIPLKTTKDHWRPANKDCLRPPKTTKYCWWPPKTAKITKDHQRPPKMTKDNWRQPKTANDHQTPSKTTKDWKRTPKSAEDHKRPP